MFDCFDFFLLSSPCSFLFSSVFFSSFLFAFWLQHGLRGARGLAAAEMINGGRERGAAVLVHGQSEAHGQFRIDAVTGFFLQSHGGGVGAEQLRRNRRRHGQGSSCFEVAGLFACGSEEAATA